MEWITQYPDEVELSDEFIETYRGWGIYLCIPNGGAVSVSNGIDAYAYSSYPFDIDRYCDFEWHINKAKEFINTQVNKLPSTCKQLELPLNY